MTNQNGVVHLFLLLIVLLIVGGLVYASVYFKIIKFPNFGNSSKSSVTTKVELKSEYKNPFDKETQYVNPFNQYKNPFVVNR